MLATGLRHSHARQGVAEAECRRGADAAEASYHEAFKDSTGMDDADLDAEHQRCMGIARRVFAGIAVGAPSVLWSLPVLQEASSCRLTTAILSQVRRASGKPMRPDSLSGWRAAFSNYASSALRVPSQKAGK